MASAPTPNDPRLGVVRAGGQYGAGHRAERTRRLPPLRPRVVRRTAAGIQDRGVVHPVAQHTGAGDHHGRSADPDGSEHLAPGPVGWFDSRLLHR